MNHKAQRFQLGWRVSLDQAEAGWRTAKDPHWGWFELEPHWCPSSPEAAPLAAGQTENLYKFVRELIDAAQVDCGTIHAVIFPEAALSYDVFEQLASRLRDDDNKVELLVSGLFDHVDDVDGVRQRRRGNFAAMAPLRVDGEMYEHISVREKHHRWKLERSQIQTYALGSALDPTRGWWEHLEIMSRSLDVVVYRQTATVTTLICEDLARHDPCQELVRGIGPNLLIALLMDSSQLSHRWPARYATVLAEDPGSSVLTLTSLGLIERANGTGQIKNPTRHIGLWRDDHGEVVELNLANDAEAMRITLQPHAYEEHTLDGRADAKNSQSWRLSGVAQVRLAREAKQTDHVKAIMSGAIPSAAAGPSSSQPRRRRPRRQVGSTSARPPREPEG